uniref:Uncharacterized protein n=1 Tax=Arundo donax TaxID=35708 RepID=A0A0A9HPB6_ARUDO
MMPTTTAFLVQLCYFLHCKISSVTPLRLWYCYVA